MIEDSIIDGLDRVLVVWISIDSKDIVDDAVEANEAFSDTLIVIEGVFHVPNYSRDGRFHDDMFTTTCLRRHVLG